MTQTDRILVDTLHTLLCELPHANDMLELAERCEDKCYYYLENSLAEGDSLPDHMWWKDQAQQLRSLLGTDNSGQVLTSVYRVLDMLEKISTLTDAERELLDLLRET